MKRLRSIVACAAVAVLAAGGCKKKSSNASSEVSGLSAVPASAQVVVVVDVARVVDAPLVGRAVEQLLLRDPGLAERWERLQTSCKLDVKQLKNVVLAIGPGPQGQQPGTGPVLMVATGKLVESELSACVRSMVGSGGGTLTGKDVGGRTLYQAKETNRTMYFAFGKPDTVVLGANEAYVTEALGPGAKAPANPDLAKWMKLVDQKAPIWAVGKVDERVRGGLVKVTNGQLAAGPVAMMMSADPSELMKLELGAVMASEADAKTLESFGKTQLGVMAMAAQAKSLGKVVDKVTISADKEVVRFKVALDTSDVNLLISALDGEGRTAQDSPPAPPPAGSAAGAGP